MSNLSEQVAALEAREMGVDPAFKTGYEAAVRRAESAERDEKRAWWKWEEAKADGAHWKSRALASESRVAAAKVEGARYALTAMANNIHVTHEEHARICEWRDINFPAPVPASPTGEPPKCWMCDGTKEFVDGLGQKLICRCCRPAPQERVTPECEHVVLLEESADNGRNWSPCGDSRIRITPADAKRIIALASTPETK